MNVCGVAPENDLGIPGALLVAPGDPAKSALVARLTAQGTLRKPPVGTSIADTEGIGVIEEWIRGLAGCP
jgi:hypothetical protein